MANALRFTQAALQPASPIPAAGTKIAAFNLRIKIKFNSNSGGYVMQCTNTGTASASLMGLWVNFGNLRFIMGGNELDIISPIVVGTYYDIEIDATGINTVTNDSDAGTVTFTVNGNSAGSITANNQVFFSSDPMLWAIGGRAVSSTLNTMDAWLFEMGWTYDGNVHYWTSDASNRGNTGALPVMTATQGGVDLIAYSESQWPTDGTAWEDTAGGADTTAPSVSVAPAVSSTGDGGHTIQATYTDDSGSYTFYGVRLDSGAAQPSATQIKAQQDSLGASVEGYQSGASSGAVASLTFTGGSVSTEYTYYFVADDATGNESAISTVTATTGAGSITVDGGTLTPGTAFTGTYSGIGSLASPITLTDTAGNSITVGITDDADGTYSNATMPALPSSGSASSVLFGTLTISGSP